MSFPTLPFDSDLSGGLLISDRLLADFDVEANVTATTSSETFMTASGRAISAWQPTNPNWITPGFHLNQVLKNRQTSQFQEVPRVVAMGTYS